MKDETASVPEIKRTKAVYFRCLPDREQFAFLLGVCWTGYLLAQKIDALNHSGHFQKHLETAMVTSYARKSLLRFKAVNHIETWLFRLLPIPSRADIHDQH